VSRVTGASRESVNILGVDVNYLPLTEFLQQIHVWSDSKDRFSIMYANVHVLNIAHGDPELRRILNMADFVYCDGSGVQLGIRLLGRHLPERMTGADWIEDLCESSAKKGTRLYFLGSGEGVAAHAAEIMAARCSGLHVVGTHHGYLQDPRVNEQAIAAINEAAPQILLVGMGTPIQEKWVATHRDQLKVPVVWVVGALFDFVAGLHPRAPRWMRKRNLEWLFRFYEEPRRLWKRYLVGNPMFLLRALAQRWGFSRSE
jgi:N-acetylglucosaminyldiphosphoundecaprenol N-acetyl-beta-D-mannosaminyltransferase